MKKYILFSLFTLSVLLQSQAQTQITGKVTDYKGSAIAFAGVFLKNAKAGTTTNVNGEFTITTSFTEKDTLVVTAMGFETYTYSFLPDNKKISLQIKMLESEPELDEVTIAAGTLEASNERSVAVFKPLDIVTTAGGQGDIVGAIQTLPGVQRNGGDQTGLMVRGGDVNESVMMIDGMVAQNAFMSNVPGVAQRSRFNPFQFKGISFSSGGYTARYGQALSAVLDLQTNDLPEKNNINLGINMAGVALSGSRLMDNNAVEFTGVYTNVNPFYGTNKTNIGFSYVPQGGSIATRWISKLNDNKGISKTSFSHTLNHVGVIVNNPAATGETMTFDMKNENTYFNTSLNYWATSTLKFFTAFSFSNNTDNISWGNVPVYRNDGRVQGRAEVWKEFSRKFNLLSGIETQRISYLQKYDTLSGGFTEMLSAAYAEGELKPVHWLGIKPGVRAEYSELVARGNIVPRLAFAVKTGKVGQISFAGGMFYQTAPTSYFIQGYKPGFQQAVHYMANYQVMKNDRVFRVEGYYKSYNQLIRENGVLYNPNEYRFYNAIIDNSGNGYAQGIDFFWRDKKSIRNFDYWISYSYIDTKRIYQNYTDKVTPTYVSTHNANVVVKYFAERLQTNFSASYNYASGRPYYRPDAEGFLIDRAPDYHNVALTCSYLTTIKNVFAVFYVSADNILNIKNVLGYRYSYDGAERYPMLPPMYRSIFIGANFSLSKFKQDEL